MLTISVERPNSVTVGRTQSYRLIIQAALTSEGSAESSSSSADDVQTTVTLADAAVFVVSTEKGLQHFERVADPVDLELPTTGDLRRTDRLDLWLPAGEEVANQLLEALVADVRKLLSSLALRTVTVEVSGGGWRR